MRPVRPAAPDPAAVRELPLHVLVRDYPEALACLREAGISVVEHGAAPLHRILPDPTAVIRRIVASTAWRGETAP